MTIESFRDERAARLFAGQPPGKGFPSDLVRPARRKLRMLNDAETLDDLRSPPGNRLEALKGDLAGRWSVRINDQFRLVFVWSDGAAREVEIVDYH